MVPEVYPGWLSHGREAAASRFRSLLPQGPPAGDQPRSAQFALSPFHIHKETLRVFENIFSDEKYSLGCEREDHLILVGRGDSAKSFRTAKVIIL